MIFALVFSTTAYGQLVKCVSKDGKVEYARDCPPGTTEQKTNIRSSGGGTGGGGSAPPAQQSLAERDAAFKKRMIEQQEAQQKGEKMAAADKEKQQQCENARAYLKSLEEGIRISRPDPKTGERIIMEDEERAKETARQRARVADLCK